MWLTYVDESGNTGHKLDDPQQPFHVLAGISVREDAVSSVAAHLDDVVGQALGTTSRTTATELHGSELKAGNGPWHGRAPADRITVYRAALEPLSWDGVFVSHASINKPKLARRGDRRLPHLWALQFLIEKLNARFRTEASATLLVADETNEHEQYALDLLFDLQTGKPRPGLDLGVVDRVIDTVHFVRSETNRGVQFADLVAYLLSRLLRTAWADGAEKMMWDDLVARNQATWREPWP